MKEENSNLKEIMEYLMKKDPSLYRQIKEAHFVRFEHLEFSQGKMISGEVTKLQFKKEGQG